MTTALNSSDSHEVHAIALPGKTSRERSGLVLNMMMSALWNTIYMEAALNQLREEGHPVMEEDARRLSPLLHGHLNMLGRYSFSMPEVVAKGALRPFRNPEDPDS
jgi:hypothetical protein